MALNPRHIEDFIKRLQAHLPGGVEGAEAMREDFRANVREALSALLARMELVTREEFEVQAALLDRAYHRLEALEAKLAALDSAGARPIGDSARSDHER
jgi:ubiquinone biosynthesis accessory factor UbiK